MKHRVKIYVKGHFVRKLSSEHTHTHTHTQTIDYLTRPQSVVTASVTFLTVSKGINDRGGAKLFLKPCLHDTTGCPTG